MNNRKAWIMGVVAVVASAGLLFGVKHNTVSVQGDAATPVVRDSVPLPVTLASLPADVASPRAWHAAWSAKIDQPKSAFGEILSAIASRGGVVYSVYGGALYAKDELNGRTRWTTGAGLLAPVVLDGDAVYAATKGGVAAFARNDGRLLWERDLAGPRAEGDPAIAADGDEILVTYRDIEALDARTGSLLWKAKAPGISPQRPIPLGYAFALPAATDGAIIDFDLYFMNRRTGALEWSSRSSGSILGQRGDIVYAIYTWPTPNFTFELGINAIDLVRHSTRQDIGYRPDALANAEDREPPWPQDWIVGNDLWVESAGNIYRYTLLASSDAQRPDRIIDAKTPAIGGAYDGQPHGDKVDPPAQVRFHVAGPVHDTLLVDTTSALWLMQLRPNGDTTIVPIAADTTEVRAATFSDSDAFAGLADGRIVDVELMTGVVRAIGKTDCWNVEHLYVDAHALLVQCRVTGSPPSELILSFNVLR